MKANFIYISVVLCTLLTIAGCVSVKHSIAPDQEQFKSCKAYCLEQLNQCAHVCGNSCHHCVVSQTVTVSKKYRRYVHQQTVQGGVIARDLKSYRDPLQCRKTTCDCPADYRQCTQTCTGILYKRLQVAPTCC
jgi:hypothetical protein